jgi:hypothetical protein
MVLPKIAGEAARILAMALRNQAAKEAAKKAALIKKAKGLKSPSYDWTGKLNTRTKRPDIVGTGKRRGVTSNDRLVERSRTRKVRDTTRTRTQIQRAILPRSRPKPKPRTNRPTRTTPTPSRRMNQAANGTTLRKTRPAPTRRRSKRGSMYG